MAEQPGQDSQEHEMQNMTDGQNRIGITGRTGKIGQAEQDRRNRTGEKGQTKQER
jgi:hypothetical protein